MCLEAGAPKWCTQSGTRAPPAYGMSPPVTLVFIKLGIINNILTAVVPCSHAGTYEPTYDPTIPEPEPNNKSGSEYCLAANYTQGYGVPYGWTYTDLKCASMLVPLCKIRAAGSSAPVYYKSNATMSTFALAMSLVNQSAAEAACNKLGGHLASFATEAEQYEVEQVGAGRAAHAGQVSAALLLCKLAAGGEATRVAGLAAQL
jgi:hypothetical protein